MAKKAAKKKAKKANTAESSVNKSKEKIGIILSVVLVLLALTSVIVFRTVNFTVQSEVMQFTLLGEPKASDDDLNAFIGLSNKDKAKIQQNPENYELVALSMKVVNTTNDRVITKAKPNVSFRGNKHEKYNVWVRDDVQSEIEIKPLVATAYNMTIIIETGGKHGELDEAIKNELIAAFRAKKQ